MAESPAKRQRLLPAPARNLASDLYLEVFLVSAVTALLLVRAYLTLTGFPQVGGHGFHIAHMLWGGLLMCVGMIGFLSTLDRQSHIVTAAVGGAGFGIFIDELGKFITSNNNYFYRPTIALIYILFILMYLAFRAIEREQRVSDRDYLINTLEWIKQTVARDLDEHTLAHARRYLAHVTSDHDLTEPVGQLIEDIRCAPTPPPSVLGKLAQGARRVYHTTVDWPPFPYVVTGFFALVALVTLATGIFIALLQYVPSLPLRLGVTEPVSPLATAADLASSVASSLLIIAGITRLGHSRLEAYRMFKISLLVTVFVTEVFRFYSAQFLALYGLGLNILCLILLNGMLAAERSRPQPQK